MGYYIRRLLGMNHTFESREEIVNTAEAALRLQLLLARDVLAITELIMLPEEYKVEDRRIQRARETVRRLG
ncbi:MAG: hypothetical protein QOG94_646 [Solirubrobacteraceae bacterium]|jgi:hypothetical protein|nr:hypothetical protein [Solirubrobacteraceae bacterium]MEA2138337.1 hypothetical protein [Solirubrobacteraceae bacterium]